jgi:hypothetical protein
MNGAKMKSHTKLISILSFLLLSTVLFSCGSAKQTNPLVGKTSFETWRNSPYWNHAAYVDYDPNTQRTYLFQKLYKEDKFDIVIFASTHCDECLLNIPQLARILEAARFPEESIKFYGLDEFSTEPTGFYKKYKIDKTPAVYFEFEDGALVHIYKGRDWQESMTYILSDRANDRIKKNASQK